MFERILKRFRELIEKQRFVVTVHAVDEMEDGGFTVVDIEQAILTGKIAQRQRDEETHEWKYLVEGWTLSEDTVVVVVKLSPTDKLVIITIYEESEQ